VPAADAMTRWIDRPAARRFGATARRLHKPTSCFKSIAPAKKENWRIAAPVLRTAGL